MATANPASLAAIKPGDVTSNTLNGGAWRRAVLGSRHQTAGIGVGIASAKELGSRRWRAIVNQIGGCRSTFYQVFLLLLLPPFKGCTDQALEVSVPSTKILDQKVPVFFSHRGDRRRADLDAVYHPPNAPWNNRPEGDSEAGMSNH